jgi:peroxiredoxin (alkyl hydroperoxide reductase subunit C)
MDTENVNGQQVSLPRIGDPAPDFEAMTTHGQLKFSEFRQNNWVILFSHPADFTPVCTTELSEFARNQEFFDQHNTKLIGLSIDSIHSHVAWINNLEEIMNVKIQYPVIADLDQQVAMKYGMLHPGESGTATVRAVFYIDPKGTIRLIMYYPLNVGRSMEEIKRTLQALQTTDEHGVACPVNWQQGEDVIVPPPKTYDEVQQRKQNPGGEALDFYLVKKKL